MDGNQIQETGADPVSDPLWQRLSTHSLDDPASALPFSHRLARENGWKCDFAARVVDEYRRFCYLGMTAGHPVTPSDQVDQAWHLHLLYTRDYWGDFTDTVLGKPFHHGPTRGGGAEGAKFRDWYRATLDSYERLFGTPPPADIWPTPERRFRNAGAFRRINMAERWVIRQPVWYEYLALAAVFGAVLLVQVWG